MADSGAVVATLIADVIGSRRAPDRGALHAHLSDAVEHVNSSHSPLTPARIMSGDEVQGTFDTVGHALAAAAALRLVLAPAAGVRFGVGWGAVTELQEQPRVEDGPGWWAARDAIDTAKALAATPGLRPVRSRYVCAPGQPGPAAEPVNAALLLQDQLLASADARALRLLRGLLAGVSQHELAEQESISASAVSQRIRHDGLAVAVAAHKLMEAIA